MSVRVPLRPSSAEKRLPRARSKISPVDLHKLNPSELEVYKSLIPPSLHSCLHSKDPWDIKSAEIYCIATYADLGQPIGLSVTTYYPSLSWAKLLTISFLDDYCSQENILATLQEVENTLKAKGCELLTYLYSSIDKNVEKLELCLRNAHWSSPTTALVRCHFDVHTFAPEWLERALKLTSQTDFEIFPWGELTEDEEASLKENDKEGAIPSSISPLNFKEPIEPINSLGIRYKGELIGWLITTRSDSKTVNFSAFYVIPEFRSTKAPMALLLTSINRLQRSNIPKAVLEINLSLVDKRWISFVKNKLAPQATLIEHLYEVSKALRATLLTPEKINN